MTKQLFSGTFCWFILTAVVGCGGNGHGSSPDGGAGAGGRSAGTGGVGSGGAGLGGNAMSTGGSPGAAGGAGGVRDGSGGTAGDVGGGGRGSGGVGPGSGGSAGGSAGATAIGGRGSGGAGGVASLGGSGFAGIGGGGRGGGAGSSACQQVETLDRSCAKDKDCVTVAHTTNCCGAGVWLGLRSTEAQAFATLESACDLSYPRCGCAAGAPTTDDGSAVWRESGASVSCQSGTCKTFATGCGQPCGPGRSCLTCGTGDAGVSVCSLQCSRDTSCTEAGYPTCQSGLGSGICAPANLSCNQL